MSSRVRLEPWTRRPTQAIFQFGLKPTRQRTVVEHSIVLDTFGEVNQHLEFVDHADDAVLGYRLGGTVSDGSGIVGAGVCRRYTCSGEPCGTVGSTLSRPTAGLRARWDRRGIPAPRQRPRWQQPVSWLPVPWPSSGRSEACARHRRTYGIEHRLHCIHAGQSTVCTLQTVLTWARDTGADLAKTKVKNGGALAIGIRWAPARSHHDHDGSRPLERDGRYALQTMCEAGGLANATLIGRLDQGYPTPIRKRPARSCSDWPLST